LSQKNLKDYPTIVFDLGEVIIDLQPEKVIEGLVEVTGNENGQYLRDLIISSPELYQFEVGKITEEEFLFAVNSHLQSAMTITKFQEIWNKMLKPVAKEKVELLNGLRKNHKILFLSNTNITHQKEFDRMISEHHGIEALEHLVDEALYSHLVGMRKPEPEIYELLVEKAGSKPDEIVFIDDRVENIESAKKLGIGGVVLGKPTDLLKLFDS